MTVKSKSTIAALVGTVGLVASFTEILNIEDTGWRSFAVGASLLCIAVAGLLWLQGHLNIGYAYKNMKACRELGIYRIYTHDKITNLMPTHIRNARNIDFMAVSGQAWIKKYKEEIIAALSEQSAKIRILTAAEDSNFVTDLEDVESDTRRGHGSAEVRQVRDLLSEYVEIANERAAHNNRIVGSVWLGHYRTELRASIVICDSTWGWFTSNLPPRRAINMPSMELVDGPNTFLKDCIAHFEKVWKLHPGHEVVPLSRSPEQRSTPP